MWQISGRSSITDFDEVVKLDREYIENWNFGKDLKILWKTVGAVLKKDGAVYGDCCVVSDIDECASVVEDKAVVMKKSDVADLREKLQKLCDEPKTVQKYKDEAAEFILKKYGWDDVVERTIELYKRGAYEKWQIRN